MCNKLWFVLSILSVVSADVPSYVHVCGRRNPNLNQCIKSSVEALREKIRVGMPELHVPTVEPLRLKSGLALGDSKDLKVFIDNVEVYDLSQFQINDLHIDLEKKTLQINVYFKTLKLKGDVDIAGKIVVPIAGKGPIELDAEHVGAKVSLRMEHANTKKGKQIFFSSMTCKLDLKGFKANFVPERGSDTAFGEIVNSVLTNGQKDLLPRVIPSLERAISTKLLDIANTICKHFTFDELFPDRE